MPGIPILLLALLLAPPAQESESRQAAEPRPTEVTSERRDPLVVYRSDGERRRWVGEKISLSLKDADLVEVLRSFAKLADVNLIVDPSVSGTVTVELHEVPWDHALSVILKTHRLGAEIDGRLIAVGYP